jgi:hypothetical protein
VQLEGPFIGLTRPEIGFARVSGEFLASSGQACERAPLTAWTGRQGCPRCALGRLFWHPRARQAGTRPPTPGQPSLARLAQWPRPALSERQRPGRLPPRGDRGMSGASMHETSAARAPLGGARICARPTSSSPRSTSASVASKHAQTAHASRRRALAWSTTWASRSTYPSASGRRPNRRVMLPQALRARELRRAAARRTRGGETSVRSLVGWHRGYLSCEMLRS